MDGQVKQTQKDSVQTLRIVPTDAPQAEDIAVLDAGLTAFNAETLKTDARPFAAFVRDEETGAVRGGVFGTVRPDILLIKKLWIDDGLRGRNFGRKLVRYCEERAASEGCERLVVDTMSFQAPDFYKNLGFRETARVENFYAGHDRVFLEKILDENI